MSLWACVGVRLDFQPSTIHLPSALFRIANLNPFPRSDTGTIYVDPHQPTILNHERDVRVFGRIHIEASLIFLVVRHRKLLVENRIQLRQSHTNLHGTDTVLTDYPRVTGT